MNRIVLIKFVIQIKKLFNLLNGQERELIGTETVRNGNGQDQNGTERVRSRTERDGKERNGRGNGAGMKELQYIKIKKGIKNP